MGGSMPDKIYEYDYNDNRLDHFVPGAEVFPEFRELKILLDILRYR